MLEYLQIPSNSDVLIAYSSSPHYVSWRNTENGSYFIQAICDVFSEHAHSESIESMLKMVGGFITPRSLTSTSSGAQARLRGVHELAPQLQAGSRVRVPSVEGLLLLPGSLGELGVSQSTPTCLYDHSQGSSCFPSEASLCHNSGIPVLLRSSLLYEFNSFH